MRPKRILRSEPAAATFLHRWQIVRHRLAFDDALALANLPPAEWVMEQDPWPGAPEGLPPNQRRMLYFSYKREQPVTCQPDGACLVTLPALRSVAPTPVVCVWEIDRSSEGLKQVQRKLPGYAEFIRAQSWQRFSPKTKNPVVVVLWVCQTSERQAQLQKLFQGHNVSRFFRLAVASQLTPKGILKDPIWKTVDGEARPFLAS